MDPSWKFGMHTVDRLEQALNQVRQLGYQVRFEWMGGQGGGICEFKGQKWLFVDLALGHLEQLNQVVEALREAPERVLLPIQPPASRRASERKSA